MDTDSTGSSSVVPEVLSPNNYRRWSVLMRNYLLSQDLWEVTQTIATVAPPNSLVNPEWIRKNAAALYAIQSSCRKDIYDSIRDISTAKESWDLLKEMHDEHNKIDQVMMEDFERTEFATLLGDIQRGDCDAVSKDFLARYPDTANWVTFSGGLTILHVACTGDDLGIVKKLVSVVSKDYLEKQDENGNTSLSIAASSGKMKIAKWLVQENDRLLTIRNNDGNIPLVVACLNRQEDMTTYLYSVTPFELLLPENSNQGVMFIKYSALHGMFDIGVDLYLRCPRLAATTGSITLLDLSNEESLFFGTTWVFHADLLLYVAYERELPSPSASDDHRLQQQQRKRIKIQPWMLMIMDILPYFIFLPYRLFGFGSSAKETYKLKLTHLYAKTVLRYWSERISTFRDTTQLVESRVISAIFQAIEHGITEIVVDILKINPDLILTNKKLTREILIATIKYRREHILRFIYSLDAGKKAVQSFGKDKDENNLLHLVAKSPSHLPGDIKNLMAGSAAWKINQELNWFEGFGSVLPSCYLAAKNLDGETPVQIFDREHDQLQKEAEEWTKKTAGSYSVVAALIVTVTFAAGFTLPGGNDQNTGYPMFLHKGLFPGFFVVNGVSLFWATSSLLGFLATLTVSCNQRHFYRYMPIGLMFSVIALTISISTMAYTFTLDVLMIYPISHPNTVPTIIFFQCNVGVLLLFYWQIPTVAAIGKMSKSKILG